MYPDFCAPCTPIPPAPLGERLATTRQLLTENFAEIVRQIAGDRPVEILQPFGARMVVVRDAAVFRRLDDSGALDRGASHDVVQRIFGEKTLFLLPQGADHTRKKAELKSRLGKDDIQRMVPAIAGAAARAVDGILQRADAPVDMNEQVLHYLFAVAGQAMAGVPVELGSHVRRFQGAVDTIIATASSTLKLALASLNGLLADLLSGDAQAAAQGMFEIGRALIEAGRQNPQPNLVRDMLERHGLEPAAAGTDRELPQELLHDVAMTFAASIFTTSNLLLAVLDHFYRDPAELAQMRELIAQDYPDGVGEATALLHNPTTCKLVEVLLSHSPVGIVVRDVAATYCLDDGDGGEHKLEPGDMVAFDLGSMQKRLAAQQAARLAEAPAGSPLLDCLDARHNDVTVTFFRGIFQCPGRFLALADAMFFVLQILPRMDARWLDGDKILQPALVNFLSGSSLMRVCPVQQQLHEALHRNLHGTPAPDAPAPAGLPPLQGAAPVRPAGPAGPVRPAGHPLHL